MAQYEVPITTPKKNTKIKYTQVGNLLIPHQTPYYETKEGKESRGIEKDMYTSSDRPIKQAPSNQTQESCKTKKKKKRKKKKA